MYFADSDFLSVMLMLLTIGAGIYSSFSKGKKREVHNAVQDKKPSIFEELSAGETEYDIHGYSNEYNDEYGNRFDSVSEETFEHVFEDMPEDTLGDALEDMHEDRAVRADEIPVFAEEGKSCGYEEEKKPSQYASSGCNGEKSGFYEEEQECENSSAGRLKKKLKKSPEDMVLFSEIMKPKYKDF